MKYINKNTGNIISRGTYIQLSEPLQRAYVYMEPEAPLVQKSEVHHTSDNMSVGDGLACCVAVPAAILLSFFD